MPSLTPSPSGSHPNTQHTSRKHRSATISSLTHPVAPSNTPRSDSSSNNTASALALHNLKSLVIKGTSSIMSVYTPPPKRRASCGQFLGMTVLGGDDGSGSMEEFDLAGIDHHEPRLGVRIETVSKGWMVPVPEGVEQNWEGHWNLVDVQDVQMMLRMLR
jgi:hypothetical protein